MNKHAPQLAAAIALPLCSLSASAALPVTVVNADPDGVGLNDNTPVQPVGGNPATTLGGQRFAVVEAAADLLGAQLDGPVPLVVKVRSSNNLACSDTNAVLAQGGSTYIFQNIPGAPLSDTFYPVGLANQFIGFDLIPPNNAANNDPSDITITFNRRIGTSGCLTRSTVYYGLDDAPPPASVNLLGIATHELIHGMGFSSAMNPNNGDFSVGSPGAYDQLVRVNIDTLPTDRFVDLTSAQRLSAVMNGGTNALFLGGNNVIRGKAELLVNRGETADGPGLYTPEKIEGGSTLSHWATALVPNQIMEPTATFDQRPTEQLGLATCALADLGWTLASDASCPDGQNNAALTFGDRYVDFGTLANNQFASRRPAVFSTDGNPVTIRRIETTGRAFLLRQSDCIGTVQLDSPCTARIDFNPPTPGVYQAELVVTYGNDQTVSTILTGQQADSNGQIPAGRTSDSDASIRTSGKLSANLRAELPYRFDRKW